MNGAALPFEGARLVPRSVAATSSRVLQCPNVPNNLTMVADDVVDSCSQPAIFFSLRIVSFFLVTGASLEVVCDGHTIHPKCVPRGVTLTMRGSRGGHAPHFRGRTNRGLFNVAETALPVHIFFAR